MRSQRSLILGKLRQASGANYLLCNRAADEIVLCRKERDAFRQTLIDMRQRLETHDDVFDFADYAQENIDQILSEIKK